MSPILCFIHIPKTAGDALRAAFLAGLPRELVFWQGVGPDNFHDLTEDDIERCAVVAGHFPRAAFDQRIRRPKAYLTLLRDPVARAVSLYEYIVNGRDTKHPDRTALRELGLKRALLEYEPFRVQVNDLQCKFVGGSPNADDAIASLHNGRWFFGMHSNVSQVISEVAEAFGWTLPPLAPSNENAPGYFERLTTPGIIDIIRSLNVEDQKLVEFVVGQNRAPIQAQLRALAETYKSGNVLMPVSNLVDAPGTRRG